MQIKPNDGDSYVRVSPNENLWEKGLVVKKVIRVPDSYVVEVNGHRYCCNKHDLTLNHPDNNDHEK